MHFQGGSRFVGSQILDILKDWFTDENNKTGCRFMVVDAHNHPRTLHFYEQNGFKYLHKTEDEEREYYHIPEDEPIQTRLMYFDLKHCSCKNGDAPFVSASYKEGVHERYKNMLFCPLLIK